MKYLSPLQRNAIGIYKIRLMARIRIGFNFPGVPGVSSNALTKARPQSDRKSRWTWPSAAGRTSLNTRTSTAAEPASVTRIEIYQQRTAIQVYCKVAVILCVFLPIRIRLRA